MRTFEAPEGAADAGNGSGKPADGADLPDATAEGVDNKDNHLLPHENFDTSMFKGVISTEAALRAKANDVLGQLVKSAAEGDLSAILKQEGEGVDVNPLVGVDGATEGGDSDLTGKIPP